MENQRKRPKRKEVKTSNKQVKKQVRKDKNGQFLPGYCPNPSGRTKGVENFATKWRRYIEKVATRKGITAEELDEQLWDTAFGRAEKGDYRFYQDIHDRVYGKPIQRNELDADVRVVEGVVMLPNKDENSMEATTQTDSGTNQE